MLGRTVGNEQAIGVARQATSQRILISMCFFFPFQFVIIEMG